MTARTLDAQIATNDSGRAVIDLDRTGGEARGLRDRTIGQHYAFNILMLEAAQETMAGILDFTRVAAQILNPMALLAAPNASLRLR